jgi:hypothetical protein
MTMMDRRKFLKNAGVCLAAGLVFANPQLGAYTNKANLMGVGLQKMDEDIVDTAPSPFKYMLAEEKLFAEYMVETARDQGCKCDYVQFIRMGKVSRKDEAGRELGDRVYATKIRLYGSKGRMPERGRVPIINKQGKSWGGLEYDFKKLAG